MSDKGLDIKKSVYELCNENPELQELLAQIGFKDITKPGMLSTVGRFMTIPKGAVAKKIDIELIKQELKDHGFKIQE